MQLVYSHQASAGVVQHPPFRIERRLASLRLDRVGEICLADFDVIRIAPGTKRASGAELPAGRPKKQGKT